MLRTWDAEQTQHFLRLSADDPLHDLWRVALGTGLRRGELLGLRWQDVDLDAPSLRVTTSLAFLDRRPHLKTTKTGVSERLGHATIGMTMDVYAHVLPAMDRDAAAAIGRALGDAPEPARTPDAT